MEAGPVVEHTDSESLGTEPPTLTGESSTYELHFELSSESNNGIETRTQEEQTTRRYPTRERKRPDRLYGTLDDC